MTPPIVPERGVPLTDETVVVPVRGPGHCDDDAAWAEFVRQYDGQPRSRPDMTDFALANRVFMADRNDLDLIVWQTAAKERIRWLSIELAKALSASPAREPEGGAVERIKAKDLKEAFDLWSATTPPDDQTAWSAFFAGSSLPRRAALTPKEAPAATGAGDDEEAWRILENIPAINDLGSQFQEDIQAAILSALRAQPQAREEAQPVKVTWVDDALNEHDRRMYVDGQQWAKVYGWDKSSLNARCNRLQAAMESPPTRPLAEGADAEKLREMRQGYAAVGAVVRRAVLEGAPDHEVAELARLAVKAMPSAALQQEGR